MPFAQMVHGSFVMGLADGPTEVHKVTVAKQVLRDYKPACGLWPSEHLPARLAAARQKYAAHLENEVGNL
jgi:acyl-CoA dehydrogenase